MNCLILSDFRRNYQFAFTYLVLLVLLVMMTTISGSFAQQDQSITLATNKDSYLPGDVVQLSGMVTGQPSPLVAIQVKDSEGNLILIRTVQVDPNGNFALQFKIPHTATSGNFNIIASARVNGFVVTQTKVIAAAVPEFGQIAGEVFGLSTIVMILILGVFGKWQKIIKF